MNGEPARSSTDICNLSPSAWLTNLGWSAKGSELFPNLLFSIYFLELSSFELVSSIDTFFELVDRLQLVNGPDPVRQYLASSTLDRTGKTNLLAKIPNLLGDRIQALCCRRLWNVGLRFNHSDWWNFKGEGSPIFILFTVRTIASLFLGPCSCALVTTTTTFSITRSRTTICLVLILARLWWRPRDGPSSKARS